MASNLRGSSQERAYRFIKARILDHRFAVGHRLRAQDLAEQMAISRTPVREALGRLEQEGLVRREGAGDLPYASYHLPMCLTCSMSARRSNCRRLR